MQQSIQNKNKQIFNRAYKTRTSRYTITKQEQEHMQQSIQSNKKTDIQQSIQNKNKQICNRAYETRTSRYAIEQTKQGQSDM